MLRACALLLSIFFTTWTEFVPTACASQPNVVVILCDNLGFGDVACFRLKPNPKPQALRLFDVQSDIAEQKDVSAKFPGLVAGMTALADRARHELGDDDQIGTGQRIAGEVANPKPLLLTN